MSDIIENSRPRGVWVYPLTEFPEVNGPVEWGRYALLVRCYGDLIDDSEVRMIHTEGVAYAVTEDKPWHWTDYAECEEFTPQQLLAIVYENAVKPVDLADWVHTFGARLESNFHLAYRWATNAALKEN